MEVRAACIQVTSGPSLQDNVEMASKFLGEACLRGAKFVFLPENVGLLGPGAVMREAATREEHHVALLAFRSLAAKLDVWISVGSLAVKLENGGLANRSYLLDSCGNIVSRYDKIHMFDVDLPNGERYRESDNYVAGKEGRVAETPWGLFGLTICYDLRFPHLYRSLAKAGASIIGVPSAFTRTTGRAHWHILLRARAIETGCFIVASAQCGRHYGKRWTYGHSLVVDPNGTILQEADEEPCFIMATLELGLVNTARVSLPSLQHDRDYKITM
ncbi:MAG: amidohydrolase [Rhodospirillaceae bacterium]|nr:amidohydrolase [Rhodospirillaceae bacterium]|tara:strand:- start:4690 stop:5508 length:819 start_codon:yes stop_codon:yes gene_type:complete